MLTAAARWLIPVLKRPRGRTVCTKAVRALASHRVSPPGALSLRRIIRGEGARPCLYVSMVKKHPAGLKRSRDADAWHRHRPEQVGARRRALRGLGEPRPELRVREGCAKIRD